MRKKIRFCFLLLTVAAGWETALYLLNHYLPNPLTRLLFPVCESPWELGKSLYWPTALSLFLLHRHLPEGNWIPLPVLLTAVAVPCALLIGDAVSPLFLLPLIAALLLALWVLWLQDRLPDSPLLWGILVFLLGIAYLLFTELPPPGRLFLDPHDAAAFVPIPF